LLRPRPVFREAFFQLASGLAFGASIRCKKAYHNSVFVVWKKRSGRIAQVTRRLGKPETDVFGGQNAAVDGPVADEAQAVAILPGRPGIARSGGPGIVEIDNQRLACPCENYRPH
jgi:hypothetical protein